MGVDQVESPLLHFEPGEPGEYRLPREAGEGDPRDLVEDDRPRTGDPAVGEDVDLVPPVQGDPLRQFVHEPLAAADGSVLRDDDRDPGPRGGRHARPFPDDLSNSRSLAYLAKASQLVVAEITTPSTPSRKPRRRK